jgi:hypothetical protein
MSGPDLVPVAAIAVQTVRKQRAARLSAGVGKRAGTRSWSGAEPVLVRLPPLRPPPGRGVAFGGIPEVSPYTS